jgi:hypothetical protein
MCNRNVPNFTAFFYKTVTYYEYVKVFGWKIFIPAKPMTAVLINFYKIFIQNAITYDSHFYPNLDSIFLSYYLFSTVNFQTRVKNNSSLTIEDIFSDNSM